MNRTAASVHSHLQPYVTGEGSGAVLHTQELISWREKETGRRATSLRGRLDSHTLPPSRLFIFQACENAALFLEHRLTALISELPHVPHGRPFHLLISQPASLLVSDVSCIDWVYNSVMIRLDGPSLLLVGWGGGCTVRFSPSFCPFSPA